MSNVTLIGLGAIGLALAKALVNGGHATTVWNRTQSRIDSAISLGATGATNIIEAIERSIPVTEKKTSLQSLRWFAKRLGRIHD